MSTEPGSLYVVATPIGNLGDFSQRAADTLGRVGLIAAEDTRHSRRLLDHLGIGTPMVSLHEHNERQRCGRIVDRLLAGTSVALISDAGTPLISDPGFRLVRAARAAGVAVRTVPGPCAAVAALSVAGLPTDRFVFEGFIAAREGRRHAQLGALAAEPRTMVFYVTPRRLADDLQAAVQTFGPDRQGVLARELTKTFETVYCDSLAGLLESSHVAADMHKGEMVLLIAGAEPADGTDAADELLRALLAEIPLRKAVAVAVRVTGLPRNRLYDRALALRGGDDPAD